MGDTHTSGEAIPLLSCSVNLSGSTILPTLAHHWIVKVGFDVHATVTHELPGPVNADIHTNGIRQRIRVHDMKISGGNGFGAIVVREISYYLGEV